MSIIQSLTISESYLKDVFALEDSVLDEALYAFLCNASFLDNGEVGAIHGSTGPPLRQGVSVLSSARLVCQAVSRCSTRLFGHAGTYNLIRLRSSAL